MKLKNKIIAFVLFVLGVVMIYLGTKAGILPPTITGIGFIFIAWGKVDFCCGKSSCCDTDKN